MQRKAFTIENTYALSLWKKSKKEKKRTEKREIHFLGHNGIKFHCCRCCCCFCRGPKSVGFELDGNPAAKLQKVIVCIQQQHQIQKQQAAFKQQKQQTALLISLYYGYGCEAAETIQVIHNLLSQTKLPSQWILNTRNFVSIWQFIWLWTKICTNFACNFPLRSIARRLIL